MKKAFFAVVAAFTAVVLTVNVVAVPYSHGGAIGDRKADGYISGYYSLLTVFDTNEDGVRLAIGVSANGQYSSTYDVYPRTTYRCGNADDTGFFDPAIPAGVFRNNDYAIYRVFGNELQAPKIATQHAVGDTVAIYTYGFGGVLGEKYDAELIGANGETLMYTSTLNFSPANYHNSDYLAPVYTENEELIGFLISKSEILTVAGLQELINSEHYIPLEYDDPVSYTYERGEPAYAVIRTRVNPFDVIWAFIRAFFNRLILFR